MQLPPRFMEKVVVDAALGCWQWNGGCSRGYGQFWHEGRTVPAHRFAYEHLVGPIQSGAVIDHLCRTKACVNPAHLEPVTQRQNVHRGDAIRPRTHCKRGHLLVAGNVYERPGGIRECLTCRIDRRRRETAKMADVLREDDDA